MFPPDFAHLTLKHFRVPGQRFTRKSSCGSDFDGLDDK